MVVQAKVDADGAVNSNGGVGKMHTPGPWSVRKGMFIHTGKFAEDAKLVASTHNREIDDMEQCEDNALLIAAAPDLLAALEELLYATPGVKMAQAIKMADEAIKKAKGE
jgi:hypothetical protein